MLARRMPPGRHREFAWQHWPIAADVDWARLVAAADADVRARSPRVLLSDVDAQAVAIAQANAERAGVTVEAAALDVGEVQLPQGRSWIVTNPPYGERVSAELRTLYAAIRTCTDLARRRRAMEAAP